MSKATKPLQQGPETRAGLPLGSTAEGLAAQQPLFSFAANFAAHFAVTTTVAVNAEYSFASGLAGGL